MKDNWYSVPPFILLIVLYLYCCFVLGDHGGQLPEPELHVLQQNGAFLETKYFLKVVTILKDLA